MAVLAMFLPVAVYAVALSYQIGLQNSLSAHSEYPNRIGCGTNLPIQ
jgi:hypothetical protein